MCKVNRDIFERMHAVESIPIDDPQYSKIYKAVSHTIKLSAVLNTSTDIDQIRERVSEIICTQLDKSTTIFVPFHTNFGRFIQLGKNVFINHSCSFLYMGGIIIEDEVMVGPRVNLISESHPLDPANRKILVLKQILIKKMHGSGLPQPYCPV